MQYNFRQLPYQIQDVLIDWEKGSSSPIDRGKPYELLVWVQFMKEEKIYKDEFDSIIFGMVYGNGQMA